MNLANPFTGLGARTDAPPLARHPPDGEAAAARLRWALAEYGPQRARELAPVAGLHNTALVGALLKHDLHIGRVTCRGGVYELDADFEESVRAEIAQVIALLQRFGYVVEEQRK